MTKKLIAIVSTVLLITASFLLSSNPAYAADHEVMMGEGNYVFNPSEITVKPGETIKFTTGTIPLHNIMSDTLPGINHSDYAMNSGDSFEVTVPADAKSGTYEFYCLPHRTMGMIGKLIVE